MPVRETLDRGVLPVEAELKRQLEAELRNPTNNPEPVIVIERPHPTTTHLFVIWSLFDGLEQVVRSRIVLDAFEEVRGEREALNVTVSMGLTPAEASRMGIA
jgi:hypothetical protein